MSDESEKQYRAVPVDIKPVGIKQEWINLRYDDDLIRKLEPGQPCGPGCAHHVTHPCERCGRYQAGLADGPRAIK